MPACKRLPRMLPEIHDRLFTSLILLGVLLTSTTHAQESGQAIHRCVGAHGEIVFSGLPCAASGASAQSNADTSSEPGGGPSVCPSSAAELRELVATAVERGDPNRVAGLLHWQGIGSGEATARLRSLRTLIRPPLLAIDAGNGNGDPAADHTPEERAVDDDAFNGTSPPDSMRVRTGSGETGGTHEQTFGIRVANGCYWLTW